MSHSGGVGGPSPKIPGVGAAPEGVSGEDVAAAMHAPIHTLGELKNVLISHFGEKEGMKVYNGFMMSFAMIMLSQVRQTAQQAQKASQSMRTGLG